MEINQKYQHTKLGNFMFSLCAKWTTFIARHRLLYYFLNYTWGILTVIAGLSTTLVLAIGKIFCKDIKFHRYHWIYYIQMPPAYWGGCSLGTVFLTDLNPTKSLRAHEFGHTAQNSLLGPFFLILVAIPSFIRYWYQELGSRKGKNNRPYDGIWFEDSASQCGLYLDNYIDSLKN